MGGEGGYRVCYVRAKPYKSLYTDDSGVIDCFSFAHSSTLTFDSGSMSIRLALNQTITSIINAKNIIPAVVPVGVRVRVRVPK